MKLLLKKLTISIIKILIIRARFGFLANLQKDYEKTLAGFIIFNDLWMYIFKLKGAICWKHITRWADFMFYWLCVHVLNFSYR